MKECAGEVSDTRAENTLAKLRSLTRDEAQQYILKYLEKLVVDHTPYETQEDVGNVRLTDWVHDSLMAIKLKAHIEKDLGIEIDITELFEDQTLDQVANMMVDILDDMQSSTFARSSTEEENFFDEELQKMSDEEIDELYEQIQKIKH